MAWTLADLEESLLVGSTLVEGSTLSEEEARQVLAGRTVVGHPVHEIRELLNHRAALRWLMEQLERAPFFSLDVLLGFHRVLMDGLSDRSGRLKASRNFTYLSDGRRHDYLPPAEVEGALLTWLAAFNADSSSDVVRDAALLYWRFEQIHPFDDGNGRVGRIAVAYWLHWKARLSLTFRAADRLEHLDVLEAATRGDTGPLVEFLRARVTAEE